MKKIKTTHYYIEETGSGGRPAAPFCIAHITDLHNVLFGERQEQLIRLLGQEEPALILCTGDLVTARNQKRGVKNAVLLLEGLAGICPVYITDGNHESRLEKYTHLYGNLYERYRKKLWNLGIHHLYNETVQAEINGMKLSLTGYVPELSAYKRIHRIEPSYADLQKVLEEPQPGRYHILMAHHPDFLGAYGQWGAYLILSGHVHGGIIRLPLAGGVFGATFRLFPPYDRGRYKTPDGKGEMIVSAGLGEHTAPFRINNPPELVFIHFGS